MSHPVFQDDVSICDEERLFRRVHPTHLVRDEDSGTLRVSSAAFKDEELSVNIESILKLDGSAPEACLRKHPNHRLVAITAADARKFSQAVCRDPLPEDRSHGLVYGLKKKPSIHQGLRSAAIWVIPSSPPKV
jgi:hypothetical protein